MLLDPGTPGNGVCAAFGLAELLLTSLLLSGPDALLGPLRSGVYGRFNGENSPCLDGAGGS